MRCPDCNKFVPYNTDEEPEEQDEPQVDGGMFSVDVRRFLTCGECGQELKETIITLETPLKWTRDGGNEEGHAEGCEESSYDFEIAYEATEDAQRTDRRGKPITNPRYMRTLYGVHATGTVTCEDCGAEAEIDVEESEAASAFDELF